jgi:KDO2-lipid IV(A) lauroyltransferase
MGWLGRAISRALYIQPQFVRRFFGVCLACLWFDFLRIRRKVILDNLKIAFPEWTEKQRVQCARRSLQHMGWNLIDYSIMPHLNPKNLDKYFVFHGIEKPYEALKEGKGLLILTLHLGYGDMALAGLSVHGLPIAMVSKEFKLKWLNDLWFGMRGKYGMTFIPPRNSSFALLKALKSKRMVVIPNDQFTGPPIGVRTTFFGKETGTAAGLSIMADRSGAPVLSTYVYRLPDGRHSIHFMNFMNTKGEPQAVTQAFNDELEKFVRLYPDQYMWLHKRWKKFVEN